ncbi:rhodanese-like domain-containing protein [Methylotuvimicrobium sp. KM2]|uniref:rhodanese-like domain-containing protein n=1 Tax=Methylotuvimicrobium sp. KM2 TaxID=3133976 RepID=UPI003100EE0D
MVENLEPKQAWQLLQTDPSAVLIDVRTKMEHSHVGHPIGAVHIPWKEYPDWQVNASFVEQVAEAVPDKNAPVLLLCRSGQRSLDAAAALETAGYSRPINILEGFEGPLDDDKHRGNRGGWRFHDLPWEQS